MPTSKHWLLVAAISLSSLVMGLPVSFADHTYQHSESQMDAIFNQLNLSADQKQRIEAIKGQSRQQAKTHWEQMHSMKSRFTDDVFGPGANLQAAEQRVDQMSSHMRDMGKLRVRTLFKIKGVLTPEQNQQFARLWKEKRDAMHAKHMPAHHTSR
jgi:Spy/CpxP family protein refolding chaperone